MSCETTPAYPLTYQIAKSVLVANPTKTPEQLRIDSLKLAKDKAAKSLAAERHRQQVAKAQQRLNALQQIKATSPTVQ